MSVRGRPILLDTNVVLEAWRASAWAALAGGHWLETVEAVVMETHTGWQKRRREQQIDPEVLRKGLKAVHKVDALARARLALAVPDIQLDVGEQDLWAHASMRQGDWVLCGPDKASLRMGVRLGFRERMVSLETLCRDVGHRPKVVLRPQFCERWLTEQLSAMVVAEGGPT